MCNFYLFLSTNSRPNNLTKLLAHSLDKLIEQRASRNFTCTPLGLNFEPGSFCGPSAREGTMPVSHLWSGDVVFSWKLDHSIQYISLAVDMMDLGCCGREGLAVKALHLEP
jgi:hypothetical protein